MSAKERFIVVPFINAGKGRIAMGEIRYQSSAEAALRLASRMGGRFCGVAAYTVILDEETGGFSEATLLSQHGTTIDIRGEV